MGGRFPAESATSSKAVIMATEVLVTEPPRCSSGPRCGLLGKLCAFT